MAQVQRVGAANVVGWVLYVLLLPIAFFEFMVAGMAFGMSTDGCHDAACDASYHVGAAITTVVVGILVVLAATAAIMGWGASRGRVILGWPFAGLLGLGLVFGIALAIVH